MSPTMPPSRLSPPKRFGLLIRMRPPAAPPLRLGRLVASETVTDCAAKAVAAGSTS